jgi:hypothetical protein
VLLNWPPPDHLWIGTKSRDQEHSMPHNSSRLEAVATIGIDIGKNMFYLVGFDTRSFCARSSHAAKSRLGSRLMSDSRASTRSITKVWGWQPAPFSSRHHLSGQEPDHARTQQRDGEGRTSRGAGASISYIANLGPLQHLPAMTKWIEL